MGRHTLQSTRCTHVGVQGMGPDEVLANNIRRLNGNDPSVALDKALRCAYGCR